MKKWYHIHKGSTFGPLTHQEVESKINDSEIGPMDLIYAEGALGWKPACEWHEFKLNFEPGSYNTIKNEWIILVKKGNEFGQEGPFKEEQILEKLKTGELRLDDFVWRDGMQEWYKISNLPNFNPSRHSVLKFDGDGPELKIKEIYEEDASTLLRSVKVLGKNKPGLNTSSFVTTSEFMKSSSPFIKGVTNEASDPKHFDGLFGSKKESKELVSSSNEKEVGPSDIDKTLVNPILSRPIPSSSAEEKSEANLPKATESSISRQRVDDLKKSLDELASELKVGARSRKSSPQAGRELGEESKRTIVEIDDSSDPEATRIMHSDELVLADIDGAKVSKNRKDPIVNIVNKNKSPRLQKKSPSLIGLVFKEVNALFPKGSWLRFIGLFFLVFITATFVLFSSFKDKGRARKAQLEVDTKIKQVKLQEKLKQEKLLEEKNKIAEIERANRRVSPSTLKVYSKDTNSSDGRLEVYTNASFHYKVEILIVAEAGKVLSDKNYYRLIEAPAEKKITYNFEQLKMPPGMYRVSVKVGELRKDVSFFRGAKNKSFMVRRNHHRKIISVWHQKEKRALYSTVTRLKDLSMQVNSLVVLKDTNKTRWKRAVINWSKKFKAGQSNYLDSLNRSNAGKLTHPLMWLTMKELSDEILMKGFDEKSNSKTFNEIISRLIKFEQEIQRLSLW